jgi:hypothetical protein
MALERTNNVGGHLFAIGCLGLAFFGIYEFLIPKNAYTQASTIETGHFCFGVSGLLAVVGGSLLAANYLANRQNNAALSRSWVFPFAGSLLIVSGIIYLFLTNILGLSIGNDSAQATYPSDALYKIYLTDKSWVKYDLPKGYGFNADIQDGREILFSGACRQGPATGNTFIFYDHKIYEIDPSGQRGNPVTVYLNECVFVRAKDGERVGVNVLFHPWGK